MSPRPANAEVLGRLESLYRHLDEEGWHVHANTVALAIEALDASIIEDDAELSETIKTIARKAFPQSTNNAWAMSDWCGRIINLMSHVPPGEYAKIHRSIYKDTADA